MKRTIYFFLLILFFATATFVYSQTVSTVVPGPSTFDDGLSVDSDGNIYASRYVGSTITKITPSGTTSIYANGFNAPNGTDFGPDGYLYVPSNVANGRVNKISPAGTVEPFITSIQYPTAVLFRSDGMMYITSYQTNRVYLADPSGNYSILYSGNGMNGPVGLREDNNGNLLVADYTDGKIFSINSSGVFSLVTQIPGIVGFIEFANGYIYATGFSTNKIYRVSLDGHTDVLAGTGNAGQTNGSALTATFSGPNGIVASHGGDSLFISDFNARSLRLITDVSTGIANLSSVAPDGYSLKQNYPNPFNPKTQITYSIPVSDFVSVKVFDINGKEVETLVNETQHPGTYQVSFHGSNYSSGIYYYKFKSGEYSRTLKMLLVK